MPISFGLPKTNIKRFTFLKSIKNSNKNVAFSNHISKNDIKISKHSLIIRNKPL
jgi:hypothetical protein